MWLSRVQTIHIKVLLKVAVLTMLNTFKSLQEMKYGGAIEKPSK